MARRTNASDRSFDPEAIQARLSAYGELGLPGLPSGERDEEGRLHFPPVRCAKDLAINFVQHGKQHAPVMEDLKLIYEKVKLARVELAAAAEVVAQTKKFRSLTPEMNEALSILDLILDWRPPLKAGRPAPQHDHLKFFGWFVGAFHRLSLDTHASREETIPWENLSDICRYFDLHTCETWALLKLPLGDALTDNNSNVDGTKLSDTIKRRYATLPSRYKLPLQKPRPEALPPQELP